MQFFAHHGVFPQENRVGGEFVVSVKLYIHQASQIMVCDDISSTVNYAEVYDLVAEEMKNVCQLIEHLAARISLRVLQTFSGVEEVEVEVCKKNPPMPAQLDEVATTFRLTRSSLTC